MKKEVTKFKSGITLWNLSNIRYFRFATFRNTNSLKMKSIVFILSTLLCLPAMMLSQYDAIEMEWAKTFGKGTSDLVHQILEDKQGNILVAGETKPKGIRSRDISVLKLAPNGNLIWGKRYGGSGDDVAKSIVEAHDGGYLIAGNSTPRGFKKSILGIIKINSQGDQLWTKTHEELSGINLKDFRRTQDGGYILAGNIKTPRAEALIVKLDAKGYIDWARTFGGSGDDYASAILELPNGGFVISGKTDSKGHGGDDIWVFKVDSNGRLINERFYGGTLDEEAVAMERTRDGNLLLAANAYGKRPGESNIWYLKIGRQGQIIWEGNQVRRIEEKATCITKAPEGYLIGGYIKEKADSKKMCILKINESGNLAWDHKFEGRVHSTLKGRKEGTEAISILSSRNGGYIVGGNTGLFLMSKLVMKFNHSRDSGKTINEATEITFRKDEPVVKNEPPVHVTPKSVPDYNPSEKESNLPETKVIEEPAFVSEVDIKIPDTYLENENTYALIIGNEDYTTFQPGLDTEANVDFAENDARIFKEYCTKTLGIPERNINLLINATYGQMLQGISKLEKLAEVSEGKAKLVFYYAGHGLPHEQSKEPYLIPVDINAANLESGIKVEDLYSRLSKHPTKRVTVFLDACFSGAGRNQGLLAMRGIKIRAKKAQPIKGNMVVFSSSTGLESSGPFKEQRHGLFTYFLLKKIQESRGIFTYGDLADYIRENVRLESVLTNSKEQTPEVQVSRAAEDSWEAWRF